MMKASAAVAFSLLTLALATSANAAVRCDGDFENVNGSWVATRTCQRAAAEHIANSENEHITHHTVRMRDETPDEFCRKHVNDIETDTYCSSYNN